MLKRGRVIRIVPSLGVLGALTVPRLAARLHTNNLQTFIGICCFALLIPLYGMLGFIPALKSAKVASLSTRLEMYILGAILGFTYGAFSSFARAAYSTLVPTGDEARFFSLYAITDKSSSFVGPLLVGVAADMFGTLRMAFVVILLGIALAIPILLSIDMDAGQRAAQAYAKQRESTSRET